VVSISIGIGTLHSRAALDAKITEQIDINQQRLGVLTTQPKNFVANL